MTRNEIIEKLNDYGYSNDYAIELLTQCETENCKFTNRLTDNELDEFSAFSDEINEGKLSGYYVACYYYQPTELTEECEDMGSLDWSIDHYDIV